jgi:hypothetical protein
MRDVETVARAICRAEKMNEDDPLGGWQHWQIAAIEVLHAIRASAPTRTEPPHKVMTSEEYAALNIKGWHQVFKHWDGDEGCVAVQYLPQPMPSTASSAPVAWVRLWPDGECSLERAWKDAPRNAKPQECVGTQLIPVIATPTPSDAMTDVAVEAEDVARAMCDADLWEGAWDEQKKALIDGGFDWISDPRMDRYLKAAPAVMRLHAATRPSPAPAAVEALRPLAKIGLWQDQYPDGPDIISNYRLQGYFTPEQIRAARAALAASRNHREAPQPDTDPLFDIEEGFDAGEWNNLPVKNGEGK